MRIFILLIYCWLSFGGIYAQQVDSLLSAIALAKTDTQKVNIYNQLAYELRNQKNVEALNYAKQALRLAEKNNFNSGIMRAKTHLGIIYYRMDDTQKAFLHASQAYEMAKIEGNISLQIANLNTLAFTYNGQNEYYLAEKYLRQSIILSLQSKDVGLLARSYNNLSYTLLMQNSLDSALKYSNDALKLDSYKNEPESKTAAWRNMGAVYAKRKQYPEALEAFDKSLKIAYQIKHNFFIINVDNRKAEVLLSSGKIQPAIEILHQSIHFSEVYNFPHERQIAYKLLGQAYAKIKEFEKAYQFEVLHISLRDSIFEIEYNRQTSDLQAKYQSYQKDTQISALSEDKKLQGVQIKQQKIIIYLSIGISILFASFIFLLYKNNVKQNKARELALKQRNEIASQNEEIRQNKEELKAQADYLKNSNGLKNKILAIISHDLRSPVNSLRSLLELYEKEHLSAIELGIIAKGVKSNVDVLYLTMDNLLHWAYAQMGGLTTNPEPVNLATIAKEILQLFEVNRANKKITIENMLEENVCVFADANQVTLILRNLLSNAIKFTPIGGKIEIQMQENEDNIVIMVKDTGIGMSKEKLENIFSPNKETSVRGTQGEKGTGLGLMLSKEFVEQNKGTIWAQSEERIGTIFNFSLPKG